MQLQAAGSQILVTCVSFPQSVLIRTLCFKRQINSVGRFHCGVRVMVHLKYFFDKLVHDDIQRNETFRFSVLSGGKFMH